MNGHPLNAMNALNAVNTALNGHLKSSSKSNKWNYFNGFSQLCSSCPLIYANVETLKLVYTASKCACLLTLKLPSNLLSTDQKSIEFYLTLFLIIN